MAETFEVLQEVTVDVSKSIPAPTVFCKQADNVVRVLRVTIQDNKEDYPIPAGFVARLRGTKADGTRIYLDARSAAENVAEFILTQNALAAYGKATCEVELSNSAGDVVKSCNLVLNVQKTAMDDSAVESTDEFQSLGAAVAGAQAAQKAAEDAANKTATDAKNAAQSAADAKEAAKTAGDAASKVTNAGVDEKLAEMQEIQNDVTAKQAQTATDAVAAAEAKTAAEAAQADAAASKTAAESSASAAKESEKAAAKSAEEAKASTPASTLDGMYTAMLDGTNTQKIFKLWWPFAVTQSENKYSCLERFAAMLDTAWGDKTYTVRNIHESVSGDASGTPLDDLADGRSAAPLVTDASTGVADWAENDPMTWYVRANAKSLADGTMEVLAVETEAAFDVTGETAPVYCFSPALAVKEWDDGSYLYTSWPLLLNVQWRSRQAIRANWVSQSHHSPS